ncbi:MAG: trehalose-phosphatase [Candidatus Omnitrophota bacterium]
MLSFNEKIVKRIALASRVFFFLDYDGTLTPIVQKPEKARLKMAARSVLRSLSNLPGVKVAVVSGRSLPDLENMIGSISGIIYVGNHGLEMKGEDFVWNHSSVKQILRIMTRIWGELRKNLYPVKGMLLENKTLGISLHYRLVPEAKVAALYRNFREIIAPWVRSGMVGVQEGKKVLEIRSRPRLWHKGKVVQRLLKKYKQQGNFLPIFIGDDRTDEDAFKVLQSSGITARVTENPRAFSTAKCYIHSPGEVLGFLRQVIKLRKRNFRGGCS